MSAALDAAMDIPTTARTAEAFEFVADHMRKAVEYRKERGDMTEEDEEAAFVCNYFETLCRDIAAGCRRHLQEKQS